MTPTHHPELDELMAYASGVSPEWMSLIIACHLTYCEVCREDVATFDDIGGALLESLPGEGGAIELPQGLELPATSEPRVTLSQDVLADVPGLPRPILPYLENTPTFRFLAPGVQHIPLTLSVSDVPARLVRFKPGFEVPDHSHAGLEMIVVLDGEFEDTTTAERYQTGDVSRREGTAIHKTRITSADPCTALMIGTARSEPKTFWGRMAQILTKV
jgi:putative transcriptional regulator